MNSKNIYKSNYWLKFMGLGLSFSVGYSLRLEQSQRLAHVIEVSNLLSIPDVLFENVVEALVSDPGSAEGKLKEASRKYEESRQSTSSIHSILPSSPGKNKASERSAGFIMIPDTRPLGSPQNTEASPGYDVLYLGRKDKKPEMFFSERLTYKVGISIMQIDAQKHPAAARMLGQLLKFDRWKKEMLRTAYTRLGETQREFFEEGDAARLHIFTQQNLADLLHIHQTTVSKMIANRSVEITTLQGKRIAGYTNDLCVTRDELAKYLIVPHLNRILGEEFESKTAYSDFELSQRVSSIKRRTVAKYRQMSGIPGNSERSDSYRAGIRKEPYRMMI